MALSLQQEQQSQDLQWEQLPEGISDLELAKKLQEEEDRRASQYYQEQEQAEAAAAAAAQAQVWMGGGCGGWEVIARISKEEEMCRLIADAQHGHTPHRTRAAHLRTHNTLLHFI